MHAYKCEDVDVHVKMKMLMFHVKAVGWGSRERIHVNNNWQVVSEVVWPHSGLFLFRL